MPMFHCYISPSISWFIRAASALGTAGWSYTYTKNIHISFVVCIPNHFPCLVKLEILNDKPKRPKYIQKRVISEAATHNFREELRSSDISLHLNANLMTDPNPADRPYAAQYPSTFRVASTEAVSYDLSRGLPTGIFDYARFIFVQYFRIVLQCTPDVKLSYVILCWINACLSLSLSTR